MATRSNRRTLRTDHQGDARMNYPQCPYCARQVRVTTPGMFDCPYCRKSFSATGQGDPPIIVLTPIIQSTPIARQVHRGPPRRQPQTSGFVEQLRIVSWGALCGFVGWLIGQFSPGGLAAIAEPGSILRHQTAIVYGAVGLVLGLILGCLMVSIDRK